jgi:hypothetical protein
MKWQDIVMMIVGFVFVVALWPSVKGKDKPAIASSIITGTGLLIMCICYATLGLWFAFSSTLLTVIMWYVLAVQVIMRRKHAKTSN